ncbi:hypothetical protein KF840_23025 [bacterium]|nr:hypothetical protein [bacterium]
MATPTDNIKDDLASMVIDLVRTSMKHGVTVATSEELADALRLRGWTCTPPPTAVPKPARRKGRG